MDDLEGRRPILEIDHLVKEFVVTSGAITQHKIGTVKAVSDVTFSVREGETFGLVGESGCGKTTIGRLVVALERANSGAIRFEGEDLSKMRRRALRRKRRNLQLMFQDPYSSLDPRMRVGTILREPLAVQKIGSRAEQAARIQQLLEEVGLARQAAQLYPHEFSGGQRQRIGFARALTLSPKLIVCDEPVSALDVSIQAQLLNLMKSLQQIHNLSYIVISHDLAVVKYLADRIGVMYLGKLMEVAPAQELYEHAAHPYTQGLIDTIPVPNPALAAARRGRHISGELPVGHHATFRLPLPHSLPAGTGGLCGGGTAVPVLRRQPRGCLPLPSPDAACERVHRRRPGLSAGRTRAAKRADAAQRRCSRTSSASLRASPMKLMATTTSTIHSPAGTMSHQ